MQRLMCGGDAAFCQITLYTYCYYYYCRRTALPGPLTVLLKKSIARIYFIVSVGFVDRLNDYITWNDTVVVIIASDGAWTGVSDADRGGHEAVGGRGRRLGVAACPAGASCQQLGHVRLPAGWRRRRQQDRALDQDQVFT